MDWGIQSKKLIRFLLWVFLSSTIVIGILLLLTILIERARESSTQVMGSLESRKNICFIMGDDKAGTRYYELAEAYFSQSEEEKVDYVIKTCRSFEEMINFINESNFEGNQPWGRIEIVSHGNAWSGLSVPIFENGKRSTPGELIKFMIQNPLKKVLDSKLDTSSRVNLWGCGVGNSPIIQNALDSMFTNLKGERPKIYSSPYYVVFKEDEMNHQTEKKLAQYWPYFYKRGFRPSDSEISNALSLSFPSVNVNWRMALNNEERGDQAFSSSFHVPVSFTMVYEDEEERPKLSTEQEKLDWVRSQSEIMDQIAMLGIDFEKFNWTVNRIRFRENGKNQAAIKAIGMSTILCILKYENEST